MNRTVVNKTESMVRVIVIMPGQWDSKLRRMDGGGPTVLTELAPGSEYVVPPGFGDLPLLTESPANLCSRTTVEIDPSVFGKDD